ncbi:MAG TPA: hypothetical protein VMG10_11650 [Gemmataceae bacterium]|nr:hypothetical protein [Gemmataceae bacterium]
MQFNLYQSTPQDKKLLTARLDSVFLLYEFGVDAANNELNITGGCAAFHASDPRPPQVQPPDWTQYAFEVEGAAGRGSFSINHAHLHSQRKVDFVNEFSRLQFAVFDVMAPRAAWFSDAAWTASFEARLAKAKDLSRFLFHRVAMKDIKERWAHAVAAEEGVAGVLSLLVVTPFVRPSLCATLLAAATQSAAQPGHMPILSLSTSYGHDGVPDHTWTHFPGDATGLPGAVSGFVMLCQGGFKSISLAEAATWQGMAGVPDRAFPRLVRTLSRYGEFQRNLENVGQHDKESAIVPPADNLPVEVLYLTGLANPLHVLPEVAR